MTCSMTGFARTETGGPWGTLVWEARSVNHRYLDVRLRLPEPLRAAEPTLRDMAGKQLGRGKIELSARLEGGAMAQTVAIDNQRLQALATALEAVRSAVPECGMPDSLELLQYPGVQQDVKPDADAIQQAARTSLQTVLSELQSMRVEEGERLATLLRERARQIGEHATAAAQRLPQVRAARHQQLRERLDELNVEADPARLEQELVLTAQRMDVAEELDRLHSHIEALEDALARPEPIGRRLDFLMQEFNREANTLGSKAQDAELTHHAVEMKVLIEQMREQVQNIE